jgi:hypothetical protein
MLGRATIEAPQMDFNTDFNLTRRLQFVDEVKKEFWHKWRAIVFQGLDRSYTWRQGQRDSQVGDVVLLKDETAAGNTYKLASWRSFGTCKMEEFDRLLWLTRISMRKASGPP